MKSSRSLVFPLLAIAILPAHAQESRALLDAPLVVAGPATRFQALLDFDGDGSVDILSSWWENSSCDRALVTLLRNDGAGGIGGAINTLAPLVDTTTPFDSPVQGGRIDIDGDGRDDFWLAFHGPASGEVAVYSSNGLAQPTRHPLLSWTGGRCSQPVFADFNGDGWLDRALVEGTTLRIWTVEFTEGTGFSLVQRTALNLGVVPDHCFAIDANQDGTTDIAVNAGGTLFVVPVVNGIAGTPQVYTHGITSMTMPMAGDIDNDGDEDMVVFDMSSYVVLRRTGRTSYALEPVTVGGPAAKLADVDNDGDLDGICCGGGGPSPVFNRKLSTFRIALNDGKGAFAPAFTMPGLGSDEIAGAVDMDHDGDVDLVAGRCIYYARGPITGVNTRPSPVVNASARAAYDFDRDGDPDFGCGIDALQRNLGDGTAAPFDPYLPAAPAGMTFAGPGYPGDFDGDGDVDLIVALLQNGSFVSMRSLWNTGGGGYTDGGDAGPAGVDFRVQPGGDWSPAASVVGDSDGDGDLDLFTRTATGSTHTSRLWLNDGAGHFVFRQDFTERVEFVGDLGGSYYGNYPDIFTTAAGGAIHFGQGVNTWMPPGGGVFFGSSPDGQSHRFVFRDLDNDGDIDLSFINQDGGYHASAMVRYQGGAGAGWYGSEVLTTTDYWAAPMSNVQLADFNGDGWDDLLSSAPEFALTAIAISLRNPTGIGFQAPILQTVYPEVNGVVQFVYGVSADIDGDGDADYLTDVWIPNLTFDGEEDGCRVQIGTGWADAHGMTPTLGAQGPFRVGLPADLRVTGAPGATSGLFTAATVPPGSVPVFPGTGLQQAQRLRITNLIPFTTSGSSAEPGSGSWMLSFTVPGYHAGRTVHYTAEIFDPTAPAGSVRTNDLRITYGP